MNMEQYEEWYNIKNKIVPVTIITTFTPLILNYHVLNYNSGKH